MSSTTPHHPRVPRKKTLEQQATVDKILQVVADQGKRYSLSQADYSAQNRLQFALSRPRRLTSDSDDSSSCASSSDLSSSPPPPTRESGISTLSDDGKMFDWSSTPRSLPPLNRVRTQRPSRAPLLETHFDERETNVNCSKKISRPMSARGQRSRPHPHDRGLTM